MTKIGHDETVTINREIIANHLNVSIFHHILSSRKPMQHIVYRYIDNQDNIVKYVGITSRELSARVKEHEKLDSWVSLSKGWHIDYFYVDTKSQSEAWESHLIALYQTYNWYNKAKSDWGIINEFLKINPYWFVYSDNDDIFDFPIHKLPLITDTKGLITDTLISINYDLPILEVHRLVARKIIQPIARTNSNNLCFIETDEEKIFDYLHRKK